VAQLVRIFVALFTIGLVAGCATTRAPVQTPQDSFFGRLTAHCGKAYSGRLVTNETADADLAGQPMVMHVRTCSDAEIRIPFHVGRKDGTWDRSRTWVITRTTTGLRLKHDHRHEDGSADKLTMYGGDTAAAGSAEVQSFPVDAESIAMFRREGRAVSVTNVWNVEINPSKFSYELRRVGTNARHFRVEFALAEPVTPPPAPWGN
jgi:hypothetical protein